MVRTIAGLRYATAGGVELAYDLHLPDDASGPLPLVVYLHGGGWLRGSREDSAGTRQRPLAALGAAVASIDYRLSGDATWPAQLADVRTALDALPALVAAQGVELSGRRALWGASAGGHLALMTALLAGGEHPAPDAVVAWFPPTDLRHMADAPLPDGARMPPFVPGGTAPPPFERLLLGLDDAADGAVALLDASPLGQVRGDAAPILLVHGDEDALVAPTHSTWLHDAIRAAGGPITTVLVHGATHEDPLLEVPEVLAATYRALAGERPRIQSA